MVTEKLIINVTQHVAANVARLPFNSMYWKFTVMSEKLEDREWEINLKQDKPISKIVNLSLLKDD